MTTLKGDMMSCKYVDNSKYSLLEGIYGVGHMKSDRNSCVNNEKQELVGKVKTSAPFSSWHSWPITAQLINNCTK